MTSTFALLRRSRIALTLALLATVAQFGLALAGNTHQARLLAQGGAALGEICTVAGTARARRGAARSPRSPPWRALYGRGLVLVWTGKTQRGEADMLQAMNFNPGVADRLAALGLTRTPSPLAAATMAN